MLVGCNEKRFIAALVDDFDCFHGKKGFVVLTKSFVKIEITKTFCYNKVFSSINKTFVAAANFLVEATKNSLVPNFVAVTKPFFFRVQARIFLYEVTIHTLPRLKYTRLVSVRSSHLPFKMH